MESSCRKITASPPFTNATHRTPKTYVDQLNRPFGSEDLKGTVYVAEFFFTSCPTICPRVKGQMLRLEEEFADHPDFRLVSFTVDPKRDT